MQMQGADRQASTTQRALTQQETRGSAAPPVPALSPRSGLLRPLPPLPAAASSRDAPRPLPAAAAARGSTCTATASSTSTWGSCPGAQPCRDMCTRNRRYCKGGSRGGGHGVRLWQVVQELGGEGCHRPSFSWHGHRLVSSMTTFTELHHLTMDCL